MNLQILPENITCSTRKISFLKTRSNPQKGEQLILGSKTKLIIIDTVSLDFESTKKRLQLSASKKGSIGGCNT